MAGEELEIQWGEFDETTEDTLIVKKFFLILAAREVFNHVLDSLALFTSTHTDQASHLHLLFFSIYLLSFLGSALSQQL